MIGLLVPPSLLLRLKDCVLRLKQIALRLSYLVLSLPAMDFGIDLSVPRHLSLIYGRV